MAYSEGWRLKKTEVDMIDCRKEKLYEAENNFPLLVKM